MGRLTVNLIGQTFNQLTVINLAGRNSNNRTLWKCLCICGQYINITSDNLKRSKTKSCGCRSLLRTHGDSGSKFYKAWTGLRARTRTCMKHYEDVSVDPAWQSYDTFKRDMYISYLKHIREYGVKNTSIDRINPYGDYTKNNCRWATNSEQGYNTRGNGKNIFKYRKREKDEKQRYSSQDN